MLALALIAVCSLACAPDLPTPPRGDAGSSHLDAEPALEIEPSASPDAVLPVLRLHVPVAASSPGQIDLQRIVVVHGKLSAAHLREIARGEISSALAGRIVPSLAWVEQRSHGELGVVVAPTAPLRPGETYAVGGGSPPFSHELKVASDGGPPLLPRVWPPADASATVQLGVWCGEAELPELSAAAALAPGELRGELRRGAVDGIGARCVRFEATGDAQPESGGQVLVGPPALPSAGGGAPIASLDPRPFTLDAAAPAPAASVACTSGEVPFGPGCAVVADDRLRVRSGDAALLWAIAGAGLDDVVATRPGDAFLVAPLPSETAISLAVATVDAAGLVARHAFSATTLPPEPHLVINEVFANPLGPEPAEEWVELYNDGLASAELAGHVLADGAGETALPSGSLAPGAYALIVNEAFTADDELDPSPAPGTVLLRVTKLGIHGLSNGGEPLTLKNGSGDILSSSPARPVPKPGMSLARAAPRAIDGLSGSFVTSWPTPGRENIIEQEIP